ncbi:unnamed protein product [Rotaria sordida]|uniref:Uncharacterized protein n=1 Tax=Rotaria sordida TaxID=392033 RepID=A0A819LIT7_9BILA|nr:unnamed protein product [Rotaria sordida]CAF3967502.1 unnamed protein product [Rotaria sordida]
MLNNEMSSMCLLLKFLFLFLLTFKLVTNTDIQTINNKTTNLSCYTCIEPLVGYTDHTDSCRFFNTASLAASSYIHECSSENGYVGEYECRKLVISFRSVETFLRRDCAPKGLCSWKDKTQSMINTPVSDCVYTNDEEEKLECIYCCNTPLCNRIISNYISIQLICWLLFIHWWIRCNYW